MSRPDYPKSVENLDLDAVDLKPGLIAAVKEFARSRPWRGSLDERKAKFLRLNDALATAHRVPAPRLIFEIDERVDSRRSVYIPALNTIIIRGRLSVVTFLHEWAHKMFGPSEFKACEFSLALFRKCFPNSWGRLRFEGHMAIRPTTSRRPESQN